jgi:hypothetical protein
VKGIGIFVSLLLIGGGIAMYVTTRPPDRSLDAEGQAWVDGFTTWRAGMARKVDRAEVEIGVSRGEKLSAPRIEPLRVCTASLAELGEPPTLLERVLENASVACAEIDYAISLNERFGSPALASTRQHLHRAGNRLTTAEFILRRQLEPSGS